LLTILQLILKAQLLNYNISHHNFIIITVLQLILKAQSLNYNISHHNFVPHYCLAANSKSTINQ